MKSLKLFALVAALFLCGSASAQFTNTTTKSNNQPATTNNSGGGAVRGYSGFIEMGYCFGIGEYDFGRFDLSTSHGFQINSHIFIGLGTGYKKFSSAYCIPLYTDFRVNFLDKKATPFFGLKMGYTTGEVAGFMMTPSLGCRFGFYENLGLTLSFGYDYQRGDVTTTYYSYYYDYYYYDVHNENLGGIFLKVGLEF